ncbi:MAG: hypothetical protein R3F56_16165 [Planctomycetota bacterium]
MVWSWHRLRELGMLLAMRGPSSAPYPVLLPVLWLGLSLGCYFACGSDQRPLWVFASFAGSWVALVRDGFTSMDGALLFTSVTGAVCMLLLGLALRRLRFPRPRFVRWFLLASVLTGVGLAVALGGFAASARGVWPYVLGGACGGLSVAAVLGAALGPILLGRSPRELLRR